MPSNPFTNTDLVSSSLYATPFRLERRTGALHAAKISGEDAAATIVELTAQANRMLQAVCDIGCGRGTTTIRLAESLAPARLVAVDLSRALLGEVRERAAEGGRAIKIVCADFHELPFLDESFDSIVAAFCLYHSDRPERVVAQIARCLRPGGRAVLVTKSADSYHDIDQMIADSGLDPDAINRPSLYQTFHSANGPAITATALPVDRVLHQRHDFRFADLDHLAKYVATSPKYQLPKSLTGNAGDLAAELRRRLPNTAVTTTSTVTYITAERR